MQATEIKWEPQGETGALVLSGAVDIFEAETLRGVAHTATQAMTGTVAGGADAAPVVLDMTHVERLDLSAVQLLCAFRQVITQTGRTLRVLPLPDNVARSLETLGVTL